MIGRRAAGVLLHPTSLPGRFGVGDLGRQADAFLDWAVAAGQAVWQVLPLGPTGHHNSPYSALSAFAGSPLLLSPEALHEEGLVSGAELSTAPGLPSDHVAFGPITLWKKALLRRSWARFRELPPHGLRDEFEEFSRGSARPEWLDDWALFSALKGRLGGRPWTGWPSELRARNPEALAAARKQLDEDVAYHAWLQFVFSRQWRRLKQEANRRGILLMGDVPIYVALDSADVWSAPHLFELDENGRALRVAGVPPDDFSATGQLWGNPLYNWERMAEEGYRWWISRLRENYRHADILRLDHFRGFAAYWDIPASSRTAAGGCWRQGPGAALFESVLRELGHVRLVAEDLGHITPDVRELLATLGLPGMKVLQFAFGSDDSDHLPGRFGPHNVVYTGTHDNDTVRGWFSRLRGPERKRVLECLGSDGTEIHWDMITAAYGSPAELAIVPVQDLFGLGSEGRMNDPSTAHGNWTWRAPADRFDPDVAGRARALADQSGRLAGPPG